MMAFDAARGVLLDVKPCMLGILEMKWKVFCKMLSVGSIAHANEWERVMSV
jgi:hypothetical protein